MEVEMSGIIAAAPGVIPPAHASAKEYVHG